RICFAAPFAFFVAQDELSDRLGRLLAVAIRLEIRLFELYRSGLVNPPLGDSVVAREPLGTADDKDPQKSFPGSRSLILLAAMFDVIVDAYQQRFCALGVNLIDAVDEEN